MYLDTFAIRMVRKWHMFQVTAERGVDEKWNAQEDTMKRMEDV